MVLRRQSSSFPDKRKILEPRKKNRHFGLFFFGITTLFSLILWLKSNKLEVSFFLPRLSLPFFSSKTYVFEKEKPTTQSLDESLAGLLKDKKGRYGIWYKNLQNGEEYGLRQDEVFKAASVNKVPILITFYQAVENKELKEKDVYILKRNDIEGGTGSMQYKTPGTSYTYGELAALSGKVSDNTAAHVLLDILGAKKVEGVLEEAGMVKTSITENTTTAYEMGSLFEQVFEGGFLTQESREKLFDSLTKTQFEDRIPVGLPKGTKVVHKIGNEVGILNDCGIIYDDFPYVLCILSQEVNEAEAQKILPEISRIVWKFNDQL